MNDTKNKVDELKQSDDTFDRFVATLCEHDISAAGAGALTLQLFGGVAKKQKGRHIRGNIHIAFIAGSQTNVPGLVDHLTDIVPNSAVVNASNSTYTGLTGTVRSLGPDSGWYLDKGALTNESTDFLTIQNIHDLDDKSINCLQEAVGSGAVTINKKGLHETVPINSSILLIDHPAFGEWDQYSPLNEQIGIVSTLSSRLDFIFVDIDGCKERKMAEQIHPNVASEYIREAQQTCSPTVPTHVDNELFEGLVEIHIEKMEKNAVPKAAESTLRRLAEASARARFSNEVTNVDAQRAITIYRRPYEELHGIDYEPPEFDNDLFILGKPQKTRKLRTIQQIIVKDGPISDEEVVEVARETGLETWEIHQILGELNGRGVISKSTNGDWYVTDY